MARPGSRPAFELDGSSSYAIEDSSFFPRSPRDSANPVNFGHVLVHGFDTLMKVVCSFVQSLALAVQSFRLPGSGRSDLLN
jgi:hypothetical protein